MPDMPSGAHITPQPLTSQTKNSKNLMIAGAVILVITVTFTNESSGPMWTASDVHPTHQILPEFDTREGIASGESYSHTFTKIGTWKFHDHLKPQYVGDIIVE